MKDIKEKSFRILSRKWYLGCCILDAMKYGRWEDVKALAKIRDLDPNVLIPEYGISPMHCAAGIEPEELAIRCVKAFLKMGGDPNVRCVEGVTPVHVATCWGRCNVLEILLNEGGDPSIVDDEGNDAFYYANGRNIDQLLSNNKSNRRSTKLDNKSFIETEMIENDDLELNPEALSLITKHRMSVDIFESIPEDTSSTSSVIDVELTEDFLFDPHSDESNTKTVVKSLNEELAETTNNELYSEDISKSDLAHVIQVISNNFVCSENNNEISVNGKSDDNSIQDSCKDLQEIDYSSKSENIVSKDIIQANDEFILPEEVEVENNSNELCIEDEYLNSSSIIPTNLITTDSNDELYNKTISSTKLHKKFKSDSSINSTDNYNVEKNHDKESRYHSLNDCQSSKDKIKVKDCSLNYEEIGYSKALEFHKFNETKREKNQLDQYCVKKRSRSSSSFKLEGEGSKKEKKQLDTYNNEKRSRSSSSIKSEGEGSKEFHESERTSDLFSSTRLPTKARDKLESFKVNTHYRTRTKVLKMISKSYDGLKWGKTLYCTGYEFWSSKVRSSCYPSEVVSRRNRKK